MINLSVMGATPRIAQKPLFTASKCHCNVFAAKCISNSGTSTKISTKHVLGYWQLWLLLFFILLLVNHLLSNNNTMRNDKWRSTEHVSGRHITSLQITSKRMIQCPKKTLSFLIHTPVRRHCIHLYQTLCPCLLHSAQLILLYEHILRSQKHIHLRARRL